MTGPGRADALLPSGGWIGERTAEQYGGTGSGPASLADGSRIGAANLALSRLPVNRRAYVRQLGGSPATRQRLAEMGLTPGTVVRVVRLAPLGDPLQIAVRDYQLSLRRSETDCVLVEPDGR